MDEKLLEYLIEKLESVSPELWAMAQRQVFINNILNTIYMLGSLGILIWLVVIWKKLLNDEIDITEWSSSLAVMLFFGSALIFLFAPMVLFSSFQYLVYGVQNPDFATLKELLSLVKVQ